MSAEVRVVDLVKRYGKTVAVNGVSLHVRGGEIFGLLGPNGAGKTSTIECILGLRSPDSGTISINGIDAVKEPARVKQIIGAQLQATALQDKLTPREALKFFGSFYRNAIKPSQLLERFSLAEKADAPFDSLSAGQRQRLALALAFVNDPQLIFLDEPTAGLDPQSRRDLHADILRLKTDGKTVVLSTHYIEEAHQLCDRIAIINGGGIIALGSPDELIRKANLPERVNVTTEPALDESKLEALSAGKWKVIPATSGCAEFQSADVTGLMIGLMKCVEAENVKLLELRIHRPTLEDAYLAITREETIDEGAIGFTNGIRNPGAPDVHPGVRT